MTMPVAAAIPQAAVTMDLLGTWCSRLLCAAPGGAGSCDDSRHEACGEAVKALGSSYERNGAGREWERSAGREQDREGGALAELGVDGHGAVVAGHDALHDAQPQAGARHLQGVGVGAAEELGEQRALVGLGDADALVGADELDPV